MPPIHATGSRCAFTACGLGRTVMPRTICQAASAQPAQAASPNGSPIPHTTMLTQGNTNGVRFAHW